MISVSHSAWQQTGLVYPIEAMTADEAAAHLANLERIEQARAGRLPPSLNSKPHLLIPALWDLVHDPRVIGPVADLLGPDLLCWGSSFFNKAPGEARYVPWHQDATYWGLERPDALTAWIAFTESDVENGCLRAVPGSHTVPLDHCDAQDANNMLYGQERLASAVDEGAAVNVVLRPGEMSLHHLLLVHGSQPNRSGRRRVGFAVRYVAGDLRQRAGFRGSATLVAGRDHGTYDLEQRPEGEFHPDALARHKAVLRSWTAMVNHEIRESRAARSADAAP